MYKRQAQPRKIISSPTWSGLESEKVSYNAGYTNVHELIPVSYTHLRAHETVLDLVCRLLLEKKKKPKEYTQCLLYKHDAT